MRTAVLYKRVATEDASLNSNHSLMQQELQLRDYCEKENIEIIDSYEECFSGNTIKRPEFQRMLDSFKMKSKRPTFILFTNWTRFSRKAEEVYQIKGVFDKLKIKLQAIEQPLDLCNPCNKLILTIYMEMPVLEKAKKSLSVKSKTKLNDMKLFIKNKKSKS